MYYLLIVSLGEQVISCLSTEDYIAAKQYAIELEASNRFYKITLLEVNREIQWKGMDLSEVA